ncbi:MAG TPA: hypothetical protein VEY93_05710, partial [Longimicrobium sp.]|nr:hypothetical protein [Longimicrobium sp.]
TSNVQRAFKAVNPNSAQRITLTNPNALTNMPPGFNSGPVPGDFHQQGIQKTRFNCFVVSGSAPSFSYFYTTGPDRQVNNVIRIDPTFTHAGGIQVAGGILAIGIEKVGQPNGGSRVHFYDLSQPTPRQMPRVITRSTETAGAVGLVQAADGNYIAVVAGWDSKRLTFHRFASLYQNGGIQGVAVTVSASGWQKYQNINLFLDTSQRLWLVGTHTSGYPIGNDDWGDLYQVSIDWARSRVTIDKREKMHFYRSGEGPRFKWGAGYYFDGNRFEVFSCEAQMPNSGVVRCDRWS